MSTAAKQEAVVANARAEWLRLFDANLPEIMAAGYGELAARVQVYAGLPKFVEDATTIRREITACGRH